MTKLETLNRIMEVVNSTEAADKEAITEFLSAEITRVSNEIERAAQKRAEKKAANQPILDRLYDEILGEQPIMASEVAELIDSTVSFASARLRDLVKQNLAKSEDVKTDKGVRKAYTKI